MLKIRAFRASEDTNACLKYAEGHRMVLESYGITKLTSTNINWLYDDNTIIILAESQDGERVYGGARIQIRSNKIALPMEDAIAELDERIYEYVKQLGYYNVAEFCGLWNSKEMAGFGIGSIYLGRIGVAITTQLNIKHLTALCSPATLRNCLKVGFEILTDLGNKGTFYYPKQDLTATGLIISDLQELKSASETDYIWINEIRKSWTGSIIEKGPKGEMDITYELEILPITV